MTLLILDYGINKRTFNNNWKDTLRFYYFFALPINLCNTCIISQCTRTCIDLFTRYCCMMTLETILLPVLVGCSSCSCIRFAITSLRGGIRDPAKRRARRNSQYRWLKLNELYLCFLMCLLNWHFLFFITF